MTQTLPRRGRWATALVALSFAAGIDAHAAKDEKAPPSLAARAEALKAEIGAVSAKDRNHVVPKALDRATTWAEQALTAAKKDEPEAGERALLKGQLQVQLAAQLIALAQLESQVRALRARARDIQQQLEQRKAKLAERDEYLKLLKVTR